MSTSHSPHVKGTIAGLLLGLLMSALDSSIVSTAMPTIVSELGGMDKYVWVFSAYMIASVASMPIFGKLSDMYGRKRLFLIGLGLFIAGSALCGAASGMTSLIVFRALQGIGGGSLLPITFTIVFDLFPPEKRGKAQGFFGAVFGLSSVLGPFLGGLFTDYLNWHWIFYINLPLGLASFILISKCYFEESSRMKHKIDWLGAVTLVGTVVCLMFAVELGSKAYAWQSLPVISLLAGAVLLLIAFVAAERRAAEPIVPLQLFRSRLFTASQSISLLFGILLYAGSSFVPMFIQGVLGGTASGASRILTPMMLGVIISSIVTGIFMAKATFRFLMCVSVILVTGSLLLLSTMNTATSEWFIMLYTVLFGFGIGMTFSILTMSSLHGIDEKHKGAANSLVNFFRLIGGSVGLTLLGSLQHSRFQDELSNQLGHEAAAALGDSHALLSVQARAAIPAQLLEKLSESLGVSIDAVFQDAILLVAAAAMLILLMGKARYEAHTKDAAPSATTTAAESM